MVLHLQRSRRQLLIIPLRGYNPGDRRRRLPPVLVEPPLTFINNAMRDMELLSVARQTKYPVDAFLFIQRGLDFTVTRLHGKRKTSPKVDEDDVSRHISGKQLCHGLRDFAIDQYGLMAQAVLRRWRITSCEDFGQIVFAMVQAEMMRKTAEDRIEDFTDVFDFAEAFSPQSLLSDNV